MAFVYNCLSSRNVPLSQAAVGIGIAALSMVILDSQNQILLPSPSSDLAVKLTKDVDLSDMMPILSANREEYEKWTGFKIIVDIWTTSDLDLYQLMKNIQESVNHTTIDYSLETYYRNTNLGSFDYSSLPSTDISKSLINLPKLFGIGISHDNPLLKSFSVPSDLPVDHIVEELRCTLQEKNIHALFFGTDSETTAFTCIENASIDSSRAKNYVVVGGLGVHTYPTTIARRSSIPSATSSQVRITPVIPGKIVMEPEMDTLAEFESGSSDLEKQGSSRHIDLGEIEIIGDIFIPEFPSYSKRSSFFVIELNSDGFRSFTYNVKDTISDKLFIQLIKILTWAKINGQFQNRRSVMCRQIGVEDSHTPLYESESISKDPFIDFPVDRDWFNGLDFLYHIGSFDAIQLQKQIVEVIFLII